MRKKLQPVLGIAMLSILLIITAGCAANTAMIEESNDTTEETEVIETKTTKDNALPDYAEYHLNNQQLYDYVDPETGVHYIILRDHNYNSGRGAMTVRYNSDGTIMVDDID